MSISWSDRDFDPMPPLIIEQFEHSYQILGSTDQGKFPRNTVESSNTKLTKVSTALQPSYRSFCRPSPAPAPGSALWRGELFQHPARGWVLGYIDVFSSSKEEGFKNATSSRSLAKELCLRTNWTNPAGDLCIAQALEALAKIRELYL